MLGGQRKIEGEAVRRKRHTWIENNKRKNATLTPSGCVFFVLTTQLHTNNCRGDATPPAFLPLLLLKKKKKIQRKTTPAMGRCLPGIHNRLADSLTTTTLEQSACDKYRKHLVRRSRAQLGGKDRGSAARKEREEREEKKNQRSEWLA